MNLAATKAWEEFSAAQKIVADHLYQGIATPDEVLNVAKLHRGFVEAFTGQREEPPMPPRKPDPLDAMVHAHALVSAAIETGAFDSVAGKSDIEVIESGGALHMLYDAVSILRDELLLLMSQAL